MVEIDVVRPELATLSLAGSTPEHGGVLVVTAAAADPATIFTETQTVLVRVVTGAGDIEDVPLERFLCEDGVRCANFTVQMKPGRSVRRVLPQLGALPSRLTTTSRDQSEGYGWVWRNADLPLVLRIMSGRDDVLRARANTADCFESCGHVLSAARPINDETAVPQNGRVEAGAGDSLAVSYVQPSGATLRFRLVMP